MNIYAFIHGKARLSDIHKNELIKKRGFTPETIEKFKFVSGGKYLFEVEHEIKAAYPEKDLLDSGVFVSGDKGIRFNSILIDDRIIIPYLDKEGIPYLLRPHKLGLPDISVEVYQRLNFTAQNLILTEGEFKAAAACQLGFPAIAVPGISSFSGKNFARLEQLLNDNQVKRITILFDHEIKNNPAFPKYYKENPAQRHDTQFYAYYMAYLLDKAGFDTRIAWFPVSWCSAGKADIDGALSQGKTAEDLARIIDAANTPKRFIEDLPPEARNIIKQKLKQKLNRSHIRVDFGHYVASRSRGKVEWDEVISNFTIKIVAAYQTPGGIIREIRFINEFQEASEICILEPSDMTEDKFKTFCYSQGNYVWRGTQSDLSFIWEQEFLDNTSKFIIEPDHVGWSSAHKIWLFDNIAITQDGRQIKPDDNRIIWTDRCGMRAISLNIGQTSEGNVPRLSTSPVDLQEVKKHFAEALGEMEAKICLGWISAIPFMEEVYRRCEFFPFLFIAGKRGSGKSTVANWLMGLAGVDVSAKAASDTTSVAIQRYLSYYSNLPVFIDEYRNTQGVIEKNGFLRSAYNRQSAGKGIKANFGIREAKIRGTLLIAGEETPTDNALKDRCIVVDVVRSNRKNNPAAWFSSQKTKLSYYFYDLLTRKPQLTAQFLRVLDEGIQFLSAKEIDDRPAAQYSIIAAGYAVTFGEEDKSFVSQLVDRSVQVNVERDQQHSAAMFIEMIANILMDGGQDADAIRKHIVVDETDIYLHISGLYQIWSKYYRNVRGENPFNLETMYKNLKDEPGFLAHSVEKYFPGARTKARSTAFNRSTSREEMRNLADMLTENTANIGAKWGER